MGNNIVLENLKPLDATFLAMQTDTAPVHVGAVPIYGNIPKSVSGASNYDSFSLMKALLEERLLSVDKFTYKLVRFPMDLVGPVWTKDNNFNIDNHIVKSSLKDPCDDKALSEFVSEIWETPLPANKPLWEFYLIDNYKQNRIAVVAKVHHSLIDGVSGANLFAKLLDLDPNVKFVPKLNEKQSRVSKRWLMKTTGILKDALLAPKLANQVAKGSASYFVNLPSSTFRVSKSMFSLISFYKSKSDNKPPTLFMAPKTSINKTVSKHRNFSFMTIKMDELFKIKTSYSVTINDIVLTLCTNSLRKYLLYINDPNVKPLTALMPISVRGEKEKDLIENQVSATVVYLPTDIEDIESQLKFVSTNATESKKLSSRVGDHLFLDISSVLPLNLQTLMAKSVYKLISTNKANPPANLIVTNVPGPQFKLYSNSIPLTNIIPIGALGEGITLCFAIFSYDGNLQISLLADPDAIAYPEELIKYLKETFKILSKRTNAKLKDENS